uniref:Uncharacterized protein n=1 Tax=Aplanochytrium stocchinoi TaxID=215587 RepID=A0A7S3PDJ3_9STRA|mmetsp:Transcript_9712/g.11178  ORF Transcript_9712/g.11178 Transcript_9712/m.11178 type:complete len:146 (+) Transcript_9712:68-505(+)
MEVADIVVVNKADGDLAATARHASTEYMHALQLMRRKHPDWRPRVKRCSALKKEKIDTVWETVSKFRNIMTENGGIRQKRLLQSNSWMWSQFYEYMKVLVKHDDKTQAMAKHLQQELSVGHTTPRKSAHELLECFLDTQSIRLQK